ncbi:hypothetical protein [Mycobacterium sp. pR1184]|uniref:hypothetical protein n=1 Tax=Mycobacterium sp. pR1184 TaxID=3238981 RepID=UPI00351BB3E6
MGTLDQATPPTAFTTAESAALTQYGGYSPKLLPQIGVPVRATVIDKMSDHVGPQCDG